MTILLYAIFGTLLEVTIVATLTIGLTRYFHKKLKNFHLIYLGKLDDNQEDDISNAMKYLKLTNGISTEKVSDSEKVSD